MVYDEILVDVFNLYYRRASAATENTVVELTNSVISYIDREVMSHLKKGNKLYLLFDPIPKDDKGLSSAFKFQTERREILHSYKSNRKYEPGVLQVFDTLRRYYSHRGDKIIEVISNRYEADDYVESLIKSLPEKDKIALLTTDLDWSRFLSDNVEMINDNFSNPFRISDFVEKYNFIPTISSVTLWKVLFGDNSDNITGVLMSKKFKNAKTLKLKAFELVKFLGEKNIELSEFENRYKGYKFIELQKLKDKNPEEDFFYELLSSDPKFSLQSNFSTVLNVVKTRCSDFSKFAVWKEEDTKINNILEKSLGHQIKGEKKKFKFGTIKG